MSVLYTSKVKSWLKSIVPYGNRYCCVKFRISTLRDLTVCRCGSCRTQCPKKHSRPFVYHWILSKVLPNQLLSYVLPIDWNIFYILSNSLGRSDTSTQNRFCRKTVVIRPIKRYRSKKQYCSVLYRLNIFSKRHKRYGWTIEVDQISFYCYVWRTIR